MEIIYIVTAFILGVIHALEPGHGKSIVASYILGTKSSLKDAILLGSTITFSHTIMIFLLGIISIFLLKNLNVDRVHDIMEIIGGLILISVGIWIIRGYFHHHDHEINRKKSIIALGLSTGLIPCPTALAVLLLSLSNGNPADGLIYVTVFSLGLAISLTGLATIFLKSREFLEKYIKSDRTSKLPLISGIIITLIGIYNISCITI